jgi:cysteine desulfurase/selenocysteine lyase
MKEVLDPLAHDVDLDKAVASDAAPSRAPALDLAAVRADFPALDQKVHGHPLIYLDSAATTQRPRAVLDAVSDFYLADNANVHRGIHELSRRATDRYEAARARVAAFLGATDPAEVIWTRGTTEAINLVAMTWGWANLKEGDEVILTLLEHHSNIVPWQLVAERTGAKLRYVGIDDEGRLDLDELDTLLSERTKLVAVGHISNALGTINPVREIVERAHRVGALVVVDGAQGAAHTQVDVQALGCDFYAFSGHKLGAPMGIGVLWARRELLEAMPPYQGGGEMIDMVGPESSTWAALPHKFEAGTPNVGGAIGMAAALDYLEGLGAERIAAHEAELVRYGLDRLGAVEGLRFFGPLDPAERTAVFSFELDGVHPHDIATILDAEGIAIRAGHHCAQPLMRRLGVAATTRASCFVYTTTEEIDRLAEGLAGARKIFGY